MAVSVSSARVPTGEIAGIVVGVLLVTALLVVVLLRVARTLERMETDAKFRRKSFIAVAAIYGTGTAFGTYNAAHDILTGKAPLLPTLFASAIGLAVSTTFIWVYARAALTTSVPPDPCQPSR